MRCFLLSLGAVLVALIVLYGGLNAVEQGMHDLLALERAPNVFTVRRSAGWELAVTFSGSTLSIKAGEWFAAITRWWAGGS